MDFSRSGQGLFRWRRVGMTTFKKGGGFSVLRLDTRTRFECLMDCSTAGLVLFFLSFRARSASRGGRRTAPFHCCGATLHGGQSTGKNWSFGGVVFLSQGKKTRWARREVVAGKNHCYSIRTLAYRPDFVDELLMGRWKLMVLTFTPRPWQQNSLLLVAWISKQTSQCTRDIRSPTEMKPT